MQTTNPTETGSTDIQTHARRASPIKSFTDLNGAIIDTEIDSFVEQVNKGIDAWRQAGHILVELSKRQPDIFRLIMAKHPAINESTLQTFARIGRKEIWPPLLVDSSIGARRLLECDYDTQKEYAEKPVKVVIAWNGKDIKTKEVPIQSLSRAECAVVFDGEGGMHTLDQQAWRVRPDKKPIEQKTIAPNAPAPAYAAPRMVNVDIGYFSLVIQPDGTVKCDPCGKSPMAQPVRVIDNGKCYKSAVVIYYKQEMK